MTGQVGARSSPLKQSDPDDGPNAEAARGPSSKASRGYAPYPEKGSARYGNTVPSALSFACTPSPSALFGKTLNVGEKAVAPAMTCERHVDHVVGEQAPIRESACRRRVEAQHLCRLHVGRLVHTRDTRQEDCRKGWRPARRRQGTSPLPARSRHGPDREARQPPRATSRPTSGRRGCMKQSTRRLPMRRWPFVRLRSWAVRSDEPTRQRPRLARSTNVAYGVGRTTQLTSRHGLRRSSTVARIRTRCPARVASSSATKRPGVWPRYQLTVVGVEKAPTAEVAPGTRTSVAALFVPPAPSAAAAHCHSM